MQDTDVWRMSFVGPNVSALTLMRQSHDAALRTAAAAAKGQSATAPSA
jgi:hypothetical protein